MADKLHESKQAAKDNGTSQMGSTTSSVAPQKGLRKGEQRGHGPSIARSNNSASNDIGEGEAGEIFEVDMWARVDPALLKAGGVLQIVGEVRIVQRPEGTSG